MEENIFIGRRGLYWWSEILASYTETVNQSWHEYLSVCFFCIVDNILSVL